MFLKRDTKCYAYISEALGDGYDYLPGKLVGTRVSGQPNDSYVIEYESTKDKETKYQAISSAFIYLIDPLPKEFKGIEGINLHDKIFYKKVLPNNFYSLDMVNLGEVFGINIDGKSVLIIDNDMGLRSIDLENIYSILGY